MITIQRNNEEFGPYEIDDVKKYVEDGQILMQDIAHRTDEPARVKTVSYFLKESKIKVKLPHSGGVVSQLKQIGGGIIFPKNAFSKKKLFNDNRFLMLALIGLAPTFLIKFTFFSGFTFYAIAVYFSMIWGLFYYYLFKTSQVKLKTAVFIFFLTQIFIILLLILQELPGIKQLYSLTDSTSIMNQLIGYIFGVGFFEELVKALPIFIIAKYSKEPLIPQTLVFYGLISGTGFGASEGVLYQTGLNSQLDYNSSFFMNIARLTSLPFLHSVWAGISAYYISFGYLYPKYRKSMFLIAIAIPAILHGLYDVFGWSIVGLSVTVLGVILLTVYLGQGSTLQSKLK
tara:strand:+ start:417 stop:1445 length:1029 start_codon:yes stop_codon:yes gene_type:complete